MYIYMLSILFAGVVLSSSGHGGGGSGPRATTTAGPTRPHPHCLRHHLTRSSGLLVFRDDHTVED